MIRHPQASRRTVAPLAFVLFLAVTLGLGAAAQALEFTVTLKNGTTFETRYRPVQAEWDENMTMFLNDRGNWIAVENNAIADVVSKAEESGFGIRLDTTTLLLGDSPGFDLTETGEDAGGGAAGGDFDLPAASTGANYSIHQFLTTPVAGAPTSTTGSIPVSSYIGEEN